MSINPNNPIKPLFSQFQQLTSESEDLSIEKALLEPLQKIIENSGKENASLEKLYDSLEHLKGRNISALNTEDFTAIYKAFSTAITETSSSSYTSLEDTSIEDLCSVEQLQKDFLKFQQAIFRVSVEDLEEFDFEQISGEAGNLRMTLNLPPFNSNDTKEAANASPSDIEGVTFPELFAKDNFDRTFSDITNEKGQALLTKQDALNLNKELVQLVDSCKDIRLEDKDLFRKVLLLCRTQYIYSSFSTSSKMLLTHLLDLFSKPDYAIDTSGKVEFVAKDDGVHVKFSYQHQIVLEKLQKKYEIPLGSWNNFCEEHNIPNKIGLGGLGEFFVSIKQGEVEFKNIKHTARLHASIDPNSVVSKALNLDDVSKLTTTIETLKSSVTHPSKKQIETLLSSLLPFKQTEHLIDFAQFAQYEIPESFENAYLAGGEIPPTTVVIGGARLVNIRDKDSAEQVILNVEELAKSLTEDPKLQEAITLQILNLCSQKVLKSLNTAQKDLIATGFDLDFQSNTTIRFERVKGFFGGIKDDAIRCKISTDLITYPKGDLTKLNSEEKNQYRSSLEMLGCAVSTTAETSFVLEINKNLLGGKISYELKEILHKVTSK